MTEKQTTQPPAEPENLDQRFYFIFDQVQKAEAVDSLPDVSIDELNEIEQIRQMVLDISDETPVFMTST